MSILGTRVVRTEDPRLLTEGGTYTDDLKVPELAGAARVTFVRSPVAEGTSPADDINASQRYREHLARVLVGRALAEASAR